MSILKMFFNLAIVTSVYLSRMLALITLAMKISPWNDHFLQSTYALRKDTSKRHLDRSFICYYFQW